MQEQHSVIDAVEQSYGVKNFLQVHSVERRYITWLDWALSYSIALVAGAVFLLWHSWWALPLLIIMWISLFRAHSFIHDVVHLGFRRNTIFARVWNFTTGIPLLVPSFMYYPHLHHHAKNLYGTRSDPEYRVFRGHGRLAGLLTIFAVGTITPLALILRFSILQLVVWCIPGAKVLIRARLSTVALDLTYNRPPPLSEGERQQIAAQETGCFMFVAGLAILAWQSAQPWQVFGSYLTITSGAFALSAARAMTSHRYSRPKRVSMSYDDQYFDTWTYSDHSLSAIVIAPLGSRFHATHHLFPSIPYYNLGKASATMKRILADARIEPLNHGNSIFGTIDRFMQNGSGQSDGAEPGK